MIIAHRYSLLWISYVLMSTYCGGMEWVVIGSIWVCRCMWQWEGIRIIGRRYRMLHTGGWGLLCGSGFLSLQRMSKSRKMMKKISFMVQKCWRNLWCNGLTRAVSFAQTNNLHQCLMRNNCGTMDYVSLALSRRQRGNLWWNTCLTYISIIGEIWVDFWIGQ